MVEFILELVAEFALQLFGELLIEVGLQAIADAFRRPAGPWLSAFGYAMLGGLVGGATLWVFPSHLVSSQVLRLVNLIASPLLAGLCMAWLGSWRAERGQRVLRIDTFAYGYLFALALALVRFHWAR